MGKTNIPQITVNGELKLSANNQVEGTLTIIPIISSNKSSATAQGRSYTATISIPCTSFQDNFLEAVLSMMNKPLDYLNLLIPEDITNDFAQKLAFLKRMNTTFQQLPNTPNIQMISTIFNIDWHMPNSDSASQLNSVTQKASIVPILFFLQKVISDEALKAIHSALSLPSLATQNNTQTPSIQSMLRMEQQIWIALFKKFIDLVNSQPNLRNNLNHRLQARHSELYTASRQALIAKNLVIPDFISTQTQQETLQAKIEKDAKKITALRQELIKLRQERAHVKQTPTGETAELQKQLATLESQEKSFSSPPTSKASASANATAASSSKPTPAEIIENNKQLIANFKQQIATHEKIKATLLIAKSQAELITLCKEKIAANSKKLAAYGKEAEKFDSTWDKDIKIEMSIEDWLKAQKEFWASKKQPSNPKSAHFAASNTAKSGNKKESELSLVNQAIVLCEKLLSGILAKSTSILDTLNPDNLSDALDSLEEQDTEFETDNHTLLQLKQILTTQKQLLKAAQENAELVISSLAVYYENKENQAQYVLLEKTIENIITHHQNLPIIAANIQELAQRIASLSVEIEKFEKDKNASLPVSTNKLRDNLNQHDEELKVLNTQKQQLLSSLRQAVQSKTQNQASASVTSSVTASTIPTTETANNLQSLIENLININQKIRGALQAKLITYLEIIEQHRSKEIETLGTNKTNNSTLQKQLEEAQKEAIKLKETNSALMKKIEEKPKPDKSEVDEKRKLLKDKNDLVTANKGLQAQLEIQATANKTLQEKIDELSRNLQKAQEAATAQETKLKQNLDTEKKKTKSQTTKIEELEDKIKQLTEQLQISQQQIPNASAATIASGTTASGAPTAPSNNRINQYGTNHPALGANPAPAKQPSNASAKKQATSPSAVQTQSATDFFNHRKFNPDAAPWDSSNNTIELTSFTSTPPSDSEQSPGSAAESPFKSPKR